MRLTDHLELPHPYRARPYHGAVDHPAMLEVLIAYRDHNGPDERPTLEQFDVEYARMFGCDPTHDIALIEVGDETVGYSRVSVSDRPDGLRTCVVFAPIVPEHVDRPLFAALVAGQERHMRRWTDRTQRSRFEAFAHHPGPDRTPTGEAAWLESLGYVTVEWGATLIRPHLDEIPDLSLPDGVDVRPVEPDHVRAIWEAHWECFRGEWDFTEATLDDIDREVANPLMDPAMWKVAWAGDEIVGQVKSYINDEENEARSYRRGYTEYISTHRDFRNQGIAGALLAMSLRELRERAMTEAALGVDTNNPGGAFHLSTRLGFEHRTFGAVYARDVT